jgi:H+-translocating NAD(P) transhydrogenase subunit alpha
MAAESPAPAASVSEGHQPQSGETAQHPAETASEQSKDMLLLIASIYILVLAGFVGFEVIGRVSPLLHTPLMSATNAISGISLVGSLIAAGNPKLGTLCNFLGFIAVTAATINVVGGFMITDRMLKMFKLKGRAEQ